MCVYIHTHTHTHTHTHIQQHEILKISDIRNVYHKTKNKLILEKKMQDLFYRKWNQKWEKQMKKPSQIADEKSKRDLQN